MAQIDPRCEGRPLCPCSAGGHPPHARRDASGLPSGARDDRRHAVLSALADRLQASGWFIDSVRFGIVTAHRRGAARPAPEPIAKIVRIYPAYTFQVREYHDIDNAICEEVGANPRAWTRSGRQNLLLNDVDRERIRREKRIVDFERTPCCAFIASDLDQGVVKAFAQSFLEAASYHWTDADLLYQAGAIVRDDGRSDQFNHAGLLVIG
jgi:hypothetical protein